MEKKLWWKEWYDMSHKKQRHFIHSKSNNSMSKHKWKGNQERYLCVCYIIIIFVLDQETEEGEEGKRKRR